MVCVCVGVFPSQSILMNPELLEGKVTKSRAGTKGASWDHKNLFSGIIKAGCSMVRLHQMRLVDHMLRSSVMH